MKTYVIKVARTMVEKQYLDVIEVPQKAKITHSLHITKPQNDTENAKLKAWGMQLGTYNLELLGLYPMPPTSKLKCPNSGQDLEV